MAFWKRETYKQKDVTADGIDFLDGADNAYAASVDAGHRIDPRAQKIFIAGVVLLSVYVVSCLLPQGLLSFLVVSGPSNGFGSATAAVYVQDFGENLKSLFAVLIGQGQNASYGYTGWMLRLVVVALAGASLALSGAVYQGSFKNALVSPSTLGVMTGANFGLMVWALGITAAGGTVSFAVKAFDPSNVFDYLSSSMGLAIVSFACCLLVVALVLVTVRMLNSTSAIVMIITGQMIGGVLGAVNNVVRYYYLSTDPYGQMTEILTQYQIASFYREFSVVDVAVIALALGLTFAVVMHYRQKMMVLSLEETEQRTLGIETRRMQILVVGVCTLLTAIVVSFCGTVGFVGFLVPHLARRLVGPNFKYLLPASAVIGALFVLGAYEIVLVTFGPEFDDMVGMYISIFGAVVFLVTALRGKGVSFGGFGR